MSWVEKIKSGIIIVTGDGKTYKPLYVLTSKKTDYNIAEFVFPEIKGSLVKRGTAKGLRITLELTFQGEDHLDVAREFEISNDDRRPWNVSHPFYDSLVLQPTSIEYDSTGLNTTMIKATMIETILEDAPRVTFDPKDKVINDAVVVDEAMAVAFVVNVDPVEPVDVTALETAIDDAKTLSAFVTKTQAEAETYENKALAASTAALNAIADPAEAIATTIDFLKDPSLFAASIKDRLALFIDQFNKFAEILADLTTPNSKSIYEVQAGTLVTSMIVSTVEPTVQSTVNPLLADYTSSNDVLFVIDQVVATYNSYLENLDSLQTSTGGDLNSYIPDFGAVSLLNSLVNYAVSNLFKIALAAKQERVLILESDSNVINLAHRFYGLNVSDSTIDQFIAQNNIGISELLQVKKGRRLLYYV